MAIGSARWWPSGEIELRNIRVFTVNTDESAAPPELLAEAGRVRVTLAGTPQQWLNEGIWPELVAVEELTLRAVRNADGTWNWEIFRNRPQVPQRVPRIQLEATTLMVEDRTTTPPKQFQVRAPQARVVYEIAPPPSSDSQRAEPAESDPPPGPAGIWRVYAVCEPPGLGEGTVEAAYTVPTHQWQIFFHFQRIHLSKELWSHVPEAVRRELPDFRLLGGEIRLSGQLSSAQGEGASPHFTFAGSAEGVRVAVAQVDTPLSDLSAQFVVTPSQILIEHLQAAWGSATIALPRLELRPEAPAGVLQGEVAIHNLRVTEELLRLHPRLRQWYDTYGPQGVLNLRGNFRFDSQGWRWHMQVFPQQMTVVYSRFPYPVRELNGILEWTDEHIWGNLYGKVGNRPVTIQGRTLLREGAWQWIVAAPSVVFEREMIDALGGAAGQRLAELRPAGDFGFRFVSLRKGRDLPPERQLEIELQDTQIQYDRFPYPLRNLRGRIRMRGDPRGESWELEETRASNNVAEILLRGRLESWEGRHFLQLHFWAKNLPLDEELRGALPSEGARQLWRDLALRGSLAELTGQVLYDSLSDRMHLQFSAEPAPGDCSIQPSWFPYRVDNLAGRLEYNDGHAIIPLARGQHGSARFSATVTYRQEPHGVWTVDLADLFAEQIPLDQELAQAVPPALQQVLRTLNPAGKINLRGQLRIQGTAHPSVPVHTQWSLFVDTHQTRLDCGLRFTAVSGTAHIVGVAQGERFACLTQLDLTSAHALGVQLTQIRGPLWADGQKILIGRLVPAQSVGQLWQGFSPPTGGSSSVSQPEVLDRQPPPPGPLTARLAGGLVSLDGVIHVGEAPHFRLGFSVHRADLGQFAQELLGRSENLRGTMYVQGELGGILGQPDTLTGQGVLQLREADIYDTPLMLALLRMLTNREPRRNVFSSVDMSFELEGQRILIPYVVFQGDAINFEGSGDVDWQGRIRLVLRANLVRADSPFPLMRQLVGDASQQLVILHVSGWLYDPVVASEPLPGVNQMLRELQQEINPKPPPKSPIWEPLGRLPRLRSSPR